MMKKKEIGCLIIPLWILIVEGLFILLLFVADRFILKLSYDLLLGTHFVIKSDDVRIYSLDKINPFLSSDENDELQYDVFYKNLIENDIIFEHMICFESGVDPAFRYDGEKKIKEAFTFGPNNRYEGLVVIVSLMEKNGELMIENYEWLDSSLINYYYFNGRCLPNGYQNTLFGF